MEKKAFFCSTRIFLLSFFKDFKVPKIRFQNYDSYWIKNRLSKISKCYKGGNLSKEDVSNIGTIPCILYGELYTHYLNKIENVLLKTDYKKNLIQSKKGDIIMPLSGETPLDISNSAVIPFDGVALGGDLIAIRTALNPLFLSYQISGKRKAQIAKIAQGKTIVHSNPKYLMNLWIFYPTLDEQNKIADMLVCLSKKIYLINVKIETLKKYRKGIQIIVFKNNTNESYSKLSSLVSFMPKSKLSAGDSIKNGKYPFYLSGEKKGTVNSFMYEGCYIIANDGGEAGFRLSNGQFAYSNHCICFRANNEWMTRNIYEYLDSQKRKITYVGFLGSGLKNIDRDYMQSFKIPSSVLTEKYAILFSLLSAKIKTLENTLFLLNAIKRYLLANMFI